MAANVLWMDHDLHAHIQDNIVHHWDLPCLQQHEYLEPGLHVAHAIGKLVMGHRATRAEAIQRRLEDATVLMPKSKWGASL